MGVFCWAFLVCLVKESKKRRQKQPGKLMAKSRSQPVNLPSPLLKYGVVCGFATSWGVDSATGGT